MKDILEHKKEFDKIISKYKLNEGEKAHEIAKFLTDSKKAQLTTPKEFATLFAMTQDEAKTFLTFIEKGLKFRDSTKQA